MPSSSSLTVLPALRFALLVGLSLGAFSCKRPLEQTGYAGDGRYEGKPPMCFQVRKETRASASSQHHLLAHFNNTCRYDVECSVYNDVNDNEQQLNLPAHHNRSLLIALETADRDFDLELECSWSP